MPPGAPTLKRLYQAKTLHLVVDDGGSGVDSSALNNVDTRALGVLGMLEMAADMDATFEIVALSPRCTRIKHVVPYGSQAR
jgi:signal transduction histidine kinase